MGKSKQVAIHPASVDAQLNAIAETLASLRTLSARQRRVLRDRARHVPDALVDLVLAVAETNDGMVGGLQLDVASARATLVEIASARAAAAAARRIALQMDDDAMQRGGPLAAQVLAAYVALRRLVKTPKGKPFARVFEEMASVVRDERRPKRAKRVGQ
jgi:hypothetical protein